MDSETSIMQPVNTLHNTSTCFSTVLL